MQNRDYIAYLNTLHNVNANNQNAYTETNTTDPFYQKTMVEREVGVYIDNELQNNKPHIFVVTGHAGDGKTGLLFQVLKSWGVFESSSVLKPYDEVTMPNGKSCTYIKDFSELDPSIRIQKLEEFKDYPAQGKFVFLVANTGPLISSFKQCFSDDALTHFVGAIDENNGELNIYDNVPISVVNVATVDNSAFVKPFLTNLLCDDLWEKCSKCRKCGHCVIYQNRNLTKSLFNQVTDFMVKHYIWEQEHDTKLTIRQIVSHLSYSITGGLECANIKNSSSQQFKYLISNLFFGFKGVEVDKKARNMYAISHILKEGYDQKRLRSDENIFIKNDFSKFPQVVQDLLSRESRITHCSEGWQRSVKRAYILFHLDTGQELNDELNQDIFSTWYPRYLELRDGAAPQSAEKELLQDALQMIFVGTIEKGEKEIPVTMKREFGISQCVQLVYDSIPKKKFKLILIPINDYSSKIRYGIYMQINGEKLNSRITLPLFNFFEETRMGAIATYVDPQLSQGIDSLKAQIISLCEADKSEVELLVMKSSGWKSVTAECESGLWKIG